jgi:hypothetical protein
VKSIALVFACCAVASAQLTLFTFDGSSETPVGSTFSFGNSSVGSNKDVRFRAHNNGSSPITISTLAVSGSGFSILAVNGILPDPIAAGNFLEFTVRFNGSIAAGYSANLQINTGSIISIILTANAVQGPLLSAVTGCTITRGAFDFGTVPIGSQHLCNFSLFNASATPMVISSIGLTGAAFTFQQNPVTPLTLSANTGAAFTVFITPVCGTAMYSGALLINGQSFSLIATGVTAPLPKPQITFDTQIFGSAEQHTIALSLAAVSPCGATGNLNLAFVPNVAGVTDDSSVFFLKGSMRSLQFAVQPNSTQVAIAGQPSVTFQTGTTAGSITFTLSGTALASDPTTSISVTPSAIAIDTATASNQVLGELDLLVIGFDNTYSAGKMAFTFYDTVGNQVGSTISADATQKFKNYFTQQSSGSTFQMRVSFPVTGDQTTIGKVQATLTNAAGSTQTGMLTFH